MHLGVCDEGHLRFLSLLAGIWRRSLGREQTYMDRVASKAILALPKAFLKVHAFVPGKPHYYRRGPIAQAL